VSQPNQNFRKAKRRLSRKHNRVFAFQQPAHGAKPPPDTVHYWTSAQLMAATQPSFLAPAALAIKTARRLCGYVWQGPSRWWPGQSVRECARRQRQARLGLLLSERF
jgi:hypothetical protein